MDKILEAGLELTLGMVVTPAESAVAVGSGSLEVFSTPSMIAFMENTAMHSVSEYLDPGMTTVGSKVNISHLCPTPVGRSVECRALLTGVDGRKLTFRVEVRDNQIMIGEGIHERVIVDKMKFMKKIGI